MGDLMGIYRPAPAPSPFLGQMGQIVTQPPHQFHNFEFNQIEFDSMNLQVSMD